MSSASARSTGTSDHLPAGPRRGPRTDAGAARSAILTAARSLFQQMDYQSVSMRAIARTAGVDTSLVSYYFGTKQGLYLQTISLPSGPHRIIAEACASSSIDELGETLVRSFLTAWHGQGTADQDDRTAGNSMQGMTQALLQEPDAFHNLHDFYQHMIVEPVAHLLGTRFDEQEAEVRAALAVTQLLGIFITRTIMGLDALRHLPDDELIAREAPTLQTILTGSLPSSAPIDDVWKDNPGPANTVPPWPHPMNPD